MLLKNMGFALCGFYLQDIHEGSLPSRQAKHYLQKKHFFVIINTKDIKRIKFTLDINPLPPCQRTNNATLQVFAFDINF